jgi:hypothetical protein
MNTNVLTMVPAVGSSLALIGTSHNDGGRVAAGYYADLDTLITSVKSRLPNAAIGIFSENPQTSPQSTLSIDGPQPEAGGIVGLRGAT